MPILRFCVVHLYRKSKFTIYYLYLLCIKENIRHKCTDQNLHMSHSSNTLSSKKEVDMKLFVYVYPYGLEFMILALKASTVFDVQFLPVKVVHCMP